MADEHKTALTRRALLGGGAAGMTLLAGGATAQPANRPPNIVFFLADDLGFADVACYGRPDLNTPNIDRIAAEGIRFTQAYANSAVCTASRVGLITGRYQYRLKIGLEEPLGSNAAIGLPPDHPTLPSLLKKHGYATTLLGKWHLGYLPDYGPLKSGYDHFWGFRGGALDYYTHTDPNHKDDLWDGDVPVHETGYMTDLLGDRAVDAVNAYAKAKQPFFLDVHFNAPHWPWEAVGDQAEAERLRKASLFHYDGGTQRTYQQMIERMDFQIGRVLKALDAQGLSGDTIAIFTSDNGGERFADTWPFTGRKTELLEGGLRIPLVMRWPAQIKKGLTTEQTAIHMDWLPTLLAAAGGTPAPDYPTDGIDLLPVMTGKAAPSPRKLFWRYKANHQRAARDGDWKILKINGNSFLFDVAADPMERANLKNRHPDIFNRLAAEWDSWNAAMLPEIRDSNTGGITADTQADHIGALRPSPEPDPAADWPGAPGGSAQ
ncbi:MAG TPA: sulfatase-like hydrolase/transferase [Rhizomicrobium sp.]|nr:sulfatase-like hydrolase/transferase [Rhizomicrobium sp.]